MDTYGSRTSAATYPLAWVTAAPVKPGTEVTVELPVLLRFGKRTVRLEDPSAKGAGGPIQSLSEPTLVPPSSPARRSIVATSDLQLDRPVRHRVGDPLATGHDGGLAKCGW